MRCNREESTAATAVAAAAAAAAAAQQRRQHMTCYRSRLLDNARERSVSPTDFSQSLAQSRPRTSPIRSAKVDRRHRHSPLTKLPSSTASTRAASTPISAAATITNPTPFIIFIILAITFFPTFQLVSEKSAASARSIPSNKDDLGDAACVLSFVRISFHGEDKSQLAVLTVGFGGEAARLVAVVANK